MSIRSFFGENWAAAKGDFRSILAKEDLVNLKEEGVITRTGIAIILGPVILLTLVIDLGYILGLHRITMQLVASLVLMLVHGVGILAGVAAIALCFIGAFQYSSSEPPVIPLGLFLGGLVACAAVSSLSFLPKLPLIRRYFGNE